MIDITTPENNRRFSELYSRAARQAESRWKGKVFGSSYEFDKNGRDIWFHITIENWWVGFKQLNFRKQWRR